MKKIFLSVVATVLLSSVAVYADGGKKLPAKKKAKIANCTKANCSNPANCHKGICPNMPGCICH